MLSTARRRLTGQGAVRQRGLSLVEMMVGITVGLFIVAGAAMLTATHLGENRRLLVETQLQQDLRAAADVIARELRRSGYVQVVDPLVWSPSTPDVQPQRNLFAGLTFNAPTEVVSYRYDRAGATSTDFGYQLVNGRIRSRIGSTVNDLTDGDVIRVTAFDVTLEPTATLELACPRLCADGTQGCWPTLEIVDAVVTITGQSVADASVQRTLSSRVRLRNDAVRFNLSPTQVCP
ncbi:MAG: prepilin-type N-terminal cleavage/methylation domain-containing protein [Rubrivivax sp.]|nr:prepilin-type N-terminal cleavage/methylation domain-containing protein [Rubrivivax sp.]